MRRGAMKKNFEFERENFNSERFNVFQNAVCFISNFNAKMGGKKSKRICYGFYMGEKKKKQE